MSNENKMLDILISKGNGHLFSLSEREIIFSAMKEFAAQPLPVQKEGMRWVKASDRLPELPNPLPPDTENEKGVLFINRTHSAGVFWFPSYGQKPESIMNLQFEGWSFEQWEWLDESCTIDTDAVEFGEFINKNDWFGESGYWYDNAFNPPTQKLTTSELYLLFKQSKH